MDVVEGKSAAERDEIPLPRRIVLVIAEIAEHVADSPPAERRRPVQEPLLYPIPQRIGILAHLFTEAERQEPLGGGIHLDVLHAERLHPVEPQDLRVSVLENQTFLPTSFCASSRRNVVSPGSLSSAATAAVVVSRASRSVSAGG